MLEKVYEVLETLYNNNRRVQTLARNDPWRSVWSAGKDKSLGTPSADWTEESEELGIFL